MAQFPEAELAPGVLWSKIQQQTHHAQGCGALQPIDTRYEYLEQGGMRFLVRILANLSRKEKADLVQQRRQQAGQSANPFLPYDPDLFVVNLSATHLCLLNKYNVVDHHILIVTRAFEEQDSWLTLADFEALALCMADIDGLAFYNGGRLAGASQRHKHLQLVPPPLCPDRSPLPLATVIADLALDPQACHPVASSRLPFRHAIVPLAGATTPTGTTLLGAYKALLTYLGADGRAPQTWPYNLLVTREWMMAVPRQQDHYRSIPVNSLGFAGSLLVKNLEQFDLLQALGPMTVLRQVAWAKSAEGE
ncbi:ATP adenylyltransferase family protein [Nodosilinea sp. PGN35]|uniref:ATP adenylyltransferase family protein n=1 Tax=Nodosilinea sp. PGN35 TaxID=3020489 RepID=UPI0023B26DD1|nr:phosphorylase [Nodosilinea sp. TSF1-S3]MDF0370143.1 phosphorylase [Nodosilinea sp. TSF1-S3]